MSYFNSQDREKHLALLCAVELMREWTERSAARMTKDELRYMRTGITWFLKANKSFLDRLPDSYYRALTNEAKVCVLSISRAEKLKELTIEVGKEDFYDLLNYCFAGCYNCEKDYKKCGKRKMFLKYDIPFCNDEKCEYKQE